MSRADDLKRMLSGARLPTESARAYQKRRQLGNVAVAAHMRGQLAQEGVKFGIVPPPGVDPQVDAMVERGNLRIVGYREQLYEIVRIDKPGMPTEFGRRRLRVVRTKGTPYRKPKEEKTNGQ